MRDFIYKTSRILSNESKRQQIGSTITLSEMFNYVLLHYTSLLLTEGNSLRVVLRRQGEGL